MKRAFRNPINKTFVSDAEKMPQCRNRSNLVRFFRPASYVRVKSASIRERIGPPASPIAKRKERPPASEGPLVKWSAHVVDSAD